MISDSLNKPAFGIIVSFMLGVAIIMVVTPMCRGTNCTIVKAPPLHEVNHSVYHIASKCYTFEAVPMDCPAQGAIEAFENAATLANQNAPVKV
jgi:hypothetical protein